MHEPVETSDLVKFTSRKPNACMTNLHDLYPGNLPNDCRINVAFIRCSARGIGRSGALRISSAIDGQFCIFTNNNPGSEKVRKHDSNTKNCTALPGTALAKHRESPRYNSKKVHSCWVTFQTQWAELRYLGLARESVWSRVLIVSNGKLTCGRDGIQFDEVAWRVKVGRNISKTKGEM